MSTNPEEHGEHLERPDEFGLVYPQFMREVEARGTEQELPTMAERLRPLIFNPMVERSEEIRPILFTPLLRDITEMYSNMLGDHVCDETCGAAFGSSVKSVKPVVEPEKPKVPVDPYPSRAGWRAAYVPAEVAAPAETKAAKPKGKIGNHEIVDTDVTFDDIGGNIKAKAILEEISLQVESPEDYEMHDVPVPRGVLLYGGPGTGKTMLAKAFANRVEAAFIEVSADDLKNQFYGGTDRNVAELFREAGRHKGLVFIFIDEINSILPDRADLHPGHPTVSMVEGFESVEFDLEQPLLITTADIVATAISYRLELLGVSLKPDHKDEGEPPMAASVG
ncbi:MAG TPA: AAA family ATPase [Candidatus Saccharimonadales bacterium]|nr:AAA family ATPase [Candidatus Saccharimonadales bacterium]